MIRTYTLEDRRVVEALRDFFRSADKYYDSPYDALEDAEDFLQQVHTEWVNEVKADRRDRRGS